MHPSATRHRSRRAVTAAATRAFRSHYHDQRRCIVNSVINLRLDAARPARLYTTARACDFTSHRVARRLSSIGRARTRPACQNADWKTHKKACQMQQKIDEIMNKAEAKSAAQPSKKPAKDRCTGCNVRFEEDEYECDQECPDCEYMTCESCSCHNSRGEWYIGSSPSGANDWCRNVLLPEIKLRIPLLRAQSSVLPRRWPHWSILQRRSASSNWRSVRGGRLRERAACVREL